MDGGKSNGKVILKKSSVDEMLKQSWRIDKNGTKGNNDGESELWSAQAIHERLGLGQPALSGYQ